MLEAPTMSARLGSTKRRSIQSNRELVSIGPLTSAAQPPVLVRSATDALELDQWVAGNGPVIDSLLQQTGAVLFRGFAPHGPEGMQKFTTAIGLKLMDYMEGATPRKKVAGNVYTSTEFPSEQTIALHNENSYVKTFPGRLCFYCVVAPEDRGETPIADVRRVLEHIPATVRRKFEEKQYLLVRNFSEHLSLDWKTSFKVSSREELEQYARRAQVEMDWTETGDLRTTQKRPAVAVHPVTGQPVWFNHIAFWHVSTLEPNVRDVLLASYGMQGLPYNTYYGDGSPIEDDVIEIIRQAYDAATIKFPWQAGDLLLVDNMLVAHGRSPFSGPRKIVVSMGDPYTRTDI